MVIHLNSLRLQEGDKVALLKSSTVVFQDPMRMSRQGEHLRGMVFVSDPFAWRWNLKSGALEKSGRTQNLQDYTQSNCSPPHLGESNWNQLGDDGIKDKSEEEELDPIRECIEGELDDFTV